MDVLRVCTIKDMNLTVGLPVTYQGKEIGRVISNINKDCEIAINSDIVKQLLNSNKCSFSLEVVRK